MILNAFSANMLSLPCTVVFRELTLAEARQMAGGRLSAVGHADTAAVFSAVLGSTTVSMNRATVALAGGDVALLGQYSGPRLPEGATALPEGATIKWMEVRVVS